MQNELRFVTDYRMLELIDWAMEQDIVTSVAHFLRQIGIRPTKTDDFRKGKASFTKEHILKACKLTGASADYIFGFTEKVTRDKDVPAIEKLKSAVREVERELQRMNTQENLRAKIR
jgi:hypothetical protein